MRVCVREGVHVCVHLCFRLSCMIYSGGGTYVPYQCAPRPKAHSATPQTLQTPRAGQAADVMRVDTRTGYVWKASRPGACGMRISVYAAATA